MQRMAGPRCSLARFLGIVLCTILLPLHIAPAKAEGETDARIDLACPGCNVIFLNIELLRADRVGLISGSGLTPHIDRFFRRGVVFHDVSAPAGETFLSNTAVQTVTPPHRIDIRAITIDKLDKLKEDRRREIRNRLTSLQSMAETLSAAGYNTIGINQGGRAGEHAFLDRGFSDFSQWSSELLLEDLIALLAQKLRQPRQAPLFVLFRPTFLHQHQYRRPDLTESLMRAKVVATEYRYQAPNGDYKTGMWLRRERREGPAVEKASERAIYRAQLDYGDAELSRLFKILGDEYVENSIIVLYSNHGSGLGDNGIYRHGTSFQSSIHVPVLIRHPAVNKPIHVTEPVALLDLVPTVYKMIGVSGQYELLVDTFDRILLGRNTGHTLLVGRNSWDEYVRQGNWKLIIQYDRIKSLFNLEQDPREEHNLYQVEVGNARRLESRLLEYKRGIK